MHKLSLNPGWGCPNKDGRVSKEGCLFCNEDGFSFFTGKALSISEQISAAMEAAKKRFNAKKFIAYFQEGSSTAAPMRRLRDAVEEIQKYPDIVGIFLSSRPDSIDREIAGYISELQNKYLTCVEIGMQSANDPSLRFLNRNHTHQTTRDAVACIRKHSTALIAVHLILGIPGEAGPEYANTLKELRDMKIDGIKFHLFHILKNTRAAQLFTPSSPDSAQSKPRPASEAPEEKIKLLTETEYRDWLIYCLERIPKKVFIERLISTAAPDCLIAPQWMNKRTLYLESLEKEMARRKTYQGAQFV